MSTNDQCFLAHQQPWILDFELAEALIEVEALTAREGSVGAGAAFGSGSEDAESTSLSEAIRAWLSWHTGEAPPVEASERPCEETASSPQPSPPAPKASGVQEERERISQTRSKSELPGPSLPDPDQQAFEWLARLAPAQYDRVRLAEARRLHLRIQTLDTEVAKIRS